MTILVFTPFFVTAQPEDCSQWWFGCADQVIGGEESTGINLWWTGEVQWWAIEGIIADTVNRVLWFMWLIALVVVLIGWFMMLTAAGNEERYNSWWKYLKNAVIGLFLIAFARFILSLIFWLLNVALFDASWWE